MTELETKTWKKEFIELTETITDPTIDMDKKLGIWRQALSRLAKQEGKSTAELIKELKRCGGESEVAKMFDDLLGKIETPQEVAAKQDSTIGGFLSRRGY